MRTMASHLIVSNFNVTNMIEDQRHKTLRIICQFDDQQPLLINQIVFLIDPGIKHVRSCLMKHATNDSIPDSL